jgi:hypothetical protein
MRGLTNLQVAVLVAVSTACTKANPDYCSTSDECSNGELCDIATHACMSEPPDAMPNGADASGPECDPNKPFAPAAEVPGLRDAMANDVHATLTSDERTIYFASNRFDYSTTMHIYRADRQTRDGTFGTPTIVPSLASMAGENNPSISSDGNTLYFDTFTNTALLRMSARSDASVAFPAATTIGSAGLVEPSITADGHMLYVANLQSGSIGRLERAGASFGPVQNVDTQLLYTQLSPATSDELTLFVTRQGGALLVTKRDSVSQPWPTPAAVTELNTHDEEFKASWVSADGCRLYLTYGPVGMKSRIYMAARPK